MRPSALSVMNLSWKTSSRQAAPEATCQLANVSQLLRFLIFALPLALIAPYSLAGQTTDNSSTDTQALIERLFDPDFDARESAEAELATVGREAIKPLAELSLEKATPEFLYRSKRILERISATGDEATFVLACCILKARFNADVSDVERQWRQTQEELAIKRLRDSGARVEIPELPMMNQVFLPERGVLIVNGQVIEAGRQSQLTPSGLPALKGQALRDAVDEILKSDLAANRKRLASGLTQQSSETDVAAQAASRAVLQNRFARRQMLGLNAEMAPRTSGAEIEFPKDWDGSERSFDSLKFIRDVTAVSFVRRPVKASQLQQLASIGSLQRLRFDSCELELAGFESEAWKAAAVELELANMPVTRELIGAIAEISGLTKVTLRSSQVDADSLRPLDLPRNFGHLQLQDMVISDELFGSISKIRQLSVLTLARCRFSIPEFEDFMVQNKSVAIEFTGKALLGVRESSFIGEQFPAPQTGCLIGEVVNGSGADQAGMKPGDVILSVNGTNIKAFEDLRLQVASHLPGDTLQVQIKRGQERLELAVTLGDSRNIQP